MKSLPEAILNRLVMQLGQHGPRPTGSKWRARAHADDAAVPCNRQPQALGTRPALTRSSNQHIHASGAGPDVARAQAMLAASLTSSEIRQFRPAGMGPAIWSQPASSACGDSALLLQGSLGDHLHRPPPFGMRTYTGTAPSAATSRFQHGAEARIRRAGGQLMTTQPLLPGCQGRRWFASSDGSTPPNPPPGKNFFPKAPPRERLGDEGGGCPISATRAARAREKLQTHRGTQGKWAARPRNAGCLQQAALRSRPSSTAIGRWSLLSTDDHACFRTGARASAGLLFLWPLALTHGHWPIPPGMICG